MGIQLKFTLSKNPKIKRKAELEAFSKYGLTNITDKYLPHKLELAKSL